MWLIDTTSLELKHVIDSKDGRFQYAILSHTWEDEEITFQEMQAGLGKEKGGYRKVEQTCKVALSAGFRYAWCDTACINKESSAELSEAINSMWQWYCDAQVCYVYLEDVDSGCPWLSDHDESESSREWRGNLEDPSDPWQPLLKKNVDPWQTAFRNSRWFTRGWTLQELLAPERIHFYSQDWKPIGTKQELVRTLSSITGIDRMALEVRQSLTGFAIARKMSWATGRQTSRVEDRTYSLLGIFDINMPLLYGEGKNAFTRLQEELIRTSNDHSILAWRPPDARHREDPLLAQDPDDFDIGSTIVHCPINPASCDFRLTNKGLVFSSVLVLTSYRVDYCVLNCQMEDNLEGPLALPLFLRSSRASTFCIQPKHNGSLFNRITVLDIFSSNTALELSDITLLRRSNRDLDFHQWLQTPVPRIWIRKAVSSSDDFDIIAAYPGELWNPKTGVLCFRVGSNGEELAASVAVRFKKSRSLLSIAFTSPTNGYWSESRNVEDELKIGIASSADHHGARHALAATRPTKTAQVYHEDGNLYRADLKIESCWGSKVYAIIVSIEPKSSFVNQKRHSIVGKWWASSSKLQ